MLTEKLKFGAVLVLRYFQLSKSEFHFVSFLGFAALLGFAIEQFKQAIRLNPQNPEAYFHRGLVFNWQGKTTQAIVDMDTNISNPSTCDLSSDLLSTPVTVYSPRWPKEIGLPCTLTSPKS